MNYPDHDFLTPEEERTLFDYFALLLDTMKLFDGSDLDIWMTAEDEKGFVLTHGATETSVLVPIGKAKEAYDWLVDAKKIVQDGRTLLLELQRAL